MAWFSKKVLRREFNDLISSIKNSFSNVKKDFSKIKGLSNLNKSQIEEIYNIVNNLNSALQDLGDRVDALDRSRIPVRDTNQESQEYQEKVLSTSAPHARTHFLERITSVQEEILKKIMALTRESSSTEIAAKDVAREMYPESDYSSVRPMISNYLDILEEFGFITKIRKRRQVFVTLTEKGENFSEIFSESKLRFSKIKLSKKRKQKDL